ncbi:hypothetical protein A0H81_04864 [Grifola frondosa]|uniref:Uncharacterized protein n=1 Tax=Grifola frondosa TaxID=5627 RepID=A0A1C7MG16_GRIFR|nr:hypothetical protein A0H81_04864 [Grifola frondosa]
MTLRGHASPLNAASYSLDGIRLVTGADDGAWRLWDALPSGPVVNPEEHTTWITAYAFSHGRSFFAMGGDHNDPTVRLWNAITGKTYVL